MLFILRQCKAGVTQAARGLAGIVVADIVLITFSCVGVAALVTSFPFLADAIKLAGGAYIAVIGWQIARASPVANETSVAGAAKPFAQGLAITLSNPKAILFFAAFFPLFTMPGVAAGSQFLKLGLIFECVNIALYCLFIWGSRHVLGRSQILKGAALNRLCGGGLLLAGSLAAALSARELIR
jgi:leucine efflux protein